MIRTPREIVDRYESQPDRSHHWRSAKKKPTGNAPLPWRRSVKDDKKRQRDITTRDMRGDHSIELAPIHAIPADQLAMRGRAAIPRSVL